MISDVFTVFVDVLGRCADFLFSIEIATDVSLGAFLVAAAILSVVIGVVFSGIRSMVAFNNEDFKQREKAKRLEARKQRKRD